MARLMLPFYKRFSVKGLLSGPSLTRSIKLSLRPVRSYFDFPTPAGPLLHPRAAIAA